MTETITFTDFTAAHLPAATRLSEAERWPHRTEDWRLGLSLSRGVAAMAGERFRFPGCTELSGVCTHPDFRGRGLARRLSRHVAAGIAARGDWAFLHAWKTNAAAIRLYESLGFRLRCEVNVAVLDAIPG